MTSKSYNEKENLASQVAVRVRPPMKNEVGTRILRAVNNVKYNLFKSDSLKNYR